MATPVHTSRMVPFAPGESLLPSPYTPFARRRLREGTSSYSPKLMSERSPVEQDDLEAEQTFVKARNAEDFCREVEDGMQLAWVGILDGVQREDMARRAGSVLAEYVRAGQEFRRASTTHNVVRKKLSGLLECLEIEAFTWGLVEAVEVDSGIGGLLASRFLGEGNFGSNEMRGGREKVRRMIRWLEELRSKELTERGTIEVRPLEDPAYRAGYTRKRLGRAVGIDPEKGILEDLEIKADERLSKAVWELLRCGRMEQAKELCCSAGQPWRAGTIGGGTAFTDVSRDGIEGGARATWREIARGVARGSLGDLIDKYERACYGVLCGEVECVLPACTDFSDRLWVRLNALFDKALENGEDISDESIILAWQQSQNREPEFENSDRSLKHRIRSIQSFLSLGKTIDSSHLEALCNEISLLSAFAKSRKIEWIARLGASVAVYLSLSGLAPKVATRSAFISILTSYIELLVEGQAARQVEEFNAGTIPPAAPVLYELVALHFRYIPDEETVAKHCADLLVCVLYGDLREQAVGGSALSGSRTSTLRLGPLCDTRRLSCLRILGKTMFDRDKEFLVSLVKATVNSVWDRFMGDMHEGDEKGPGEGVSKVEMVVRSLEFLMFPEYSDYDLAVLKTLHLVRKFFLENERELARDIVEWIPTGVVNEARQSGLIETQDMDCWRCYMDAVTKFGTWREYATQNQPAPLPQHIREHAEGGSEASINFEVQAAAVVRLESYVREMEAFVGVAKGLRDSALEALNRILQFDGGWMKADQGREIRRLVVPQITAMLQSVYEESGMYEEAVKLAVLVTEPKNTNDSALYEDFEKSELKAFLKRVAQHAVLLADKEIKKEGDALKAKPYMNTFFEEATSSSS